MLQLHGGQHLLTPDAALSEGLRGLRFWETGVSLKIAQGVTRLVLTVLCKLQMLHCVRYRQQLVYERPEYRLMNEELLLRFRLTVRWASFAGLFNAVRRRAS